MGSIRTDGSKRNKYILAVISGLLLLSLTACAIIASVKIAKSQNKNAITITKPATAAHIKAVMAICAPTDYKDTCVGTLTAANSDSDDPRDLIKLVFQIAQNSIKDGIKKATEELYQEAAKDPMTKQALDTCGELMERAVKDLKKTLDRLGTFTLADINLFVHDLKTWLSGALTNQQTCIDGFLEIQSASAHKLQSFLTTAQQLTSNGLAVASNLSNLLKTIPLLKLTQREMLEQKRKQRRPIVIGYHGLMTKTAATITADVIVAQDGSGKFKTINEALSAVPKDNNKTFVIYIKQGVYREQVTVNSTMLHVMFIGDGPTKTRISGNLSFLKKVGTYHTATVAIDGDFFLAKDIGFENTAGAAEYQAVALRVSADYAVFFNCHIDGYQDTLYIHTNRQFYRDCTISGTIDFIFGDAEAVFQSCNIVVRKPLPEQQCIVTAQGRTDRFEETGIILQNCHISGSSEYLPVQSVNKAYLGRPWKEFSKTIIMQTEIDNIIDPQGWLKWNETFGLDTLYYAEYMNKGPGAALGQRVTWNGIKKISDAEAFSYTPARFISGDTWIPLTGVPYLPSMF